MINPHNPNNMKSKLLSALLSCACAFSLSAQDAKYVFYFIGDGMGMGHVNTTETYNRDVLHSSDPLLMLRFPVAGQVRTYSASHPITDSAAAGTALSTGVKTRNGMIGEGADSLAVQSIAVDFMRVGRAVGIASSVAGDDATPAAFYAHAHNRGDKYVIAPQAATSGYDFLAAPVWRGMSDENGTRNSWLDTMADAGYQVFSGYEAYTQASPTPTKALLLSANPQGDQVGFTLDSIPGALTLPQITNACLSTLEATGKDGFFMMVEGGNIDWGGHANDGATVIKEILNFQQAIDVAYQFYLAHPQETLIVITADHDTGGMAFGREDNQKKGDLALADLQKISKDRFSEYCRDMVKGGKQFTWAEMTQFIKENFGLMGAIPVNEAEERELHRAFDATFVTRTDPGQKSLYADYNAFSTTLVNVLNRHMGIGWTSGYHTANLVPVYAVGAGSQLFGKSLNNTDIPMLILQAAGLQR